MTEGPGEQVLPILRGPALFFGLTFFDAPMARSPRESAFVPGTHNEQQAFRDLTGSEGAIDWHKVDFGFADDLCDQYDECELAVLDRAARFYGLKRNSVALIANAIPGRPSEVISTIKSKIPSASTVPIDQGLAEGIMEAMKGGEDCDYMLGKALGVSTDVYCMPGINIAAINAGRSVEVMRNLDIQPEDIRYYGFGMGMADGIGGVASAEMIYSAVDLYGLDNRVVGHYRGPGDPPSALSARGVWIYETGQVDTFLVVGDLIAESLGSACSSSLTRPEALFYGVEQLLSWLEELAECGLYANFLDIRASAKFGLPRPGYVQK